MDRRWASKGFTIVELLIVIVVIAILAAITIVSYNGVTNRAADSAVSADLVNIAKKIEQQRIDGGSNLYPIGTALNFVVQVNKKQYATAPTLTYNLLLCFSPSLSTPENYVILATSKSGKKFTIGSGEGVTEYTGSASWTSADPTATCTNTRTDWVPSGAGYRSTDPVSAWRSWTGSN